MNSNTNEFGDSLLVKVVKFEYSHNRKTISVGLEGSKANALSPAYFETFKKETNYIRTILWDLASTISSNFVVEIQVNKDGKFNHNELKCTFIKSLNRESNGKVSPLAKVFKSVERMLPFSEYMHEVHLYGYKNSLCNFEIRLNLSLEDVLEVFSFPLIAPRARQQWLNVMQDFDTYTKGHYSCSCCLPVVDGEFELDGIMYYLSSKEVFRRIQ